MATHRVAATEVNPTSPPEISPPGQTPEVGPTPSPSVQPGNPPEISPPSPDREIQLPRPGHDAPPEISPPSEPQVP